MAICDVRIKGLREMKEDSAVSHSQATHQRTNGCERTLVSLNDPQHHASNRAEAQMNKTFVAAAAWSISLGATLAGQTTVPPEKAALAVLDIRLHAIQWTQE